MSEIKWKSTSTDKQLMILQYLKKRKTPSTLKQVYLQTKMEKRPCDQALRQLENKGFIKTWITMNIVKERVYEYVTDKIEEKPAVKYARKFSKTRINLDTKFFSDPFNIGK
jgi:DNA-binding MarR family transcriptional regulator